MYFKLLGFYWVMIFKMFYRTQFLSPDLKPIHPTKLTDKYIPPIATQILNRYSSAKQLEKPTASNIESQNGYRKRVENYTYCSTDLIGEGCTSKVFKARKDNETEIYAVKVIDLRKYSTSSR